MQEKEDQSHMKESLNWTMTTWYVRVTGQIKSKLGKFQIIGS